MEEITKVIGVRLVEEANEIEVLVLDEYVSFEFACVSDVLECSEGNRQWLPSSMVAAYAPILLLEFYESKCVFESSLTDDALAKVRAEYSKHVSSSAFPLSIPSSQSSESP